MPPFRTFFLWLHLAAVVVWVGGMVAVPFVITPVLRRDASAHADEVVRTVVRRFQRLSRELMLVILLTGIFNLISIGVLTDFSFSPSFVRTVAAKSVLFVVMAGNQAWYSYSLVPRARRREATWSAVLNVVLAGAVLYLGLTLR